jgi:Zn ribbon nucleic-acid-binding protein
VSEKIIEKAIDISKYKLGEIIKGLNCPKCRAKNEMKLSGLHRQETKSHELECQNDFYTQRVDPKAVEFNYEEPKEPKKKKGDTN